MSVFKVFFLPTALTYLIKYYIYYNIIKLYYNIHIFIL